MPGSEVHIANKEVATSVWDLWETELTENINIQRFFTKQNWLTQLWRLKSWRSTVVKLGIQESRLHSSNSSLQAWEPGCPKCKFNSKFKEKRRPMPSTDSGTERYLSYSAIYSVHISKEWLRVGTWLKVISLTQSPIPKHPHRCPINIWPKCPGTLWINQINILN